MASIDFNLPIREQLYVLPDTELVTNEEKDFILNFVWIEYAVFFRKESINKTIVGSKLANRVATKRDVENVIKGGKQKNLTFTIALDNLLKESERLDNKHIIKRVEELMSQLKNTLADCTILTGTHYTGLSEKEMQISTVMAFIESSIMLDLIPVTDVSKKINISDDTIRQACRSGRIMARKFTNTWLVYLEECKEYWKDNRNIEK